jgi:16S rRNA (guanine527-N7)-methyltransferase
VASELTLDQFDRRLQAAAPEPLSERTVAALHTHYRSLLRWNRQTSLVGPGTLEMAVEVHYGESLAALPLLGDLEGETLVDIGTGAGFPGFVLAAARPAAVVFLVEARERKWSFLKAITSESSVAAECLLGAVDRSLPKGFPARVDYVTLRALKLSTGAWQAILSRLAGAGRILIWAGAEAPVVPSSLRLARSLDLPRTRSKRILEMVRSDE